MWHCNIVAQVPANAAPCSVQASSYAEDSSALHQVQFDAVASRTRTVTRLQTIETYRDYAAFWCRKWMEMVQFERENIRFLCPLNLPVSNDKGILWQATWQSMWSLCGQFMSVPHVAYPPISAGWTEDERNESVQICALDSVCHCVTDRYECAACAECAHFRISRKVVGGFGGSV